MTCLSRLHEMGVKFAIDDYGIGYSSPATSAGCRSTA